VITNCQSEAYIPFHENHHRLRRRIHIHVPRRNGIRKESHDVTKVSFLNSNAFFIFISIPAVKEKRVTPRSATQDRKFICSHRNKREKKSGETFQSTIGPKRIPLNICTTTRGIYESTRSIFQIRKGVVYILMSDRKNTSCDVSKELIF
jgi:hypothetical protein